MASCPKCGKYPLRKRRCPRCGPKPQKRVDKNDKILYSDKNHKE